MREGIDVYSVPQKKGGTIGVLNRAGRPVTQLALERWSEKILSDSKMWSRSLNTVARGSRFDKFLDFVESGCHFQVF